MLAGLHSGLTELHLFLLYEFSIITVCRCVLWAMSLTECVYFFDRLEFQLSWQTCRRPAATTASSARGSEAADRIFQAQGLVFSCLVKDVVFSRLSDWFCFVNGWLAYAMGCCGLTQAWCACPASIIDRLGWNQLNAVLICSYCL